MQGKRMDLSAKIQYSELALKIYMFALQFLFNYQFSIISKQQHLRSISKSSLLTFWSQLNSLLYFTKLIVSEVRFSQHHCVTQQPNYNKLRSCVFTYLRSLYV
ncbi:Hypothetical_protein [Hexamita inflata]|uniref:Hypothetical_protein n=1 Tax=Hexamita inflata TaxID=28002 RepID=A0ABP1IKE9_9EUKA